MQRTWAACGWLVLSIAIGACGDESESPSDGRDGGDQQPNGEPDGGGSVTERPCGELAEDRVCVVGKVASAAPSGKREVSVSVLGQPTSTVKTKEDGSFALALDKTLNPVATAGGKASARRDTKSAGEYTLILHNEQEKAGRVLQAKVSDEDKAPGDPVLVDVGSVELLPTGKVAGEVTLAGESDHTGIQVYLPGTSYLATTAANGQFLISDVPAGLFPFARAERDGYNFAIVADVEVPSDATVTLPPLRLGVDTGAAGTFGFAEVITDAQGSYSSDATVLVELVATDDAVLMMVSEDRSFVGASWRPIETQLQYTFEGDGAHTLYVKFANANGLESSPASAAITIDTDPRVQVLSPATSTTSSRPIIDWSDTRITGATYTLQLAEDADFTSLLVAAQGLTESRQELTDTTLATGRSYFARVRIDDGAPRSWSDVRSFSVDFGSVTLVSPQGAQPSSRPVLDWSEPLLANARYHVQLAEGSSFSAPLVDVTDLTSSSLALSQTLESGKQYAFRVAVKDEHGVEGAFSSAQTFSIDLGAVAIDPPGNPQSDSTPTLTWSASPLPSATYRVQIAEDATFASPVDQATGLTQNAYTTATLEHGQSYYVRVAVVDQHGAQGSWAGPTSFGVNLGSVTLSAPAEDTLTNDSTPSFSWTGNAVAASYTLSYGTDPALAGATQVTGIAQTQHTLTSALPNTPLTTYYWAVTPVDANGVSGTRSAIQSFRLDTQAPTGIFAINNNDTTTYSEVVSVLFRGSDASGVVEVMAAKADPDPGAVWVTPGSITLDYSNLATTNTATITAYGYFKDAAGNVSQKYTDSITLTRTVVQAGTISANTTWSAAQNPYYITGDVIVLHPATLTLAAGVTVYFKSGRKIEVRSGGHAGEAGISAVGTGGSPITLHGARIELNYAADWVNAGRGATYDGSGNYVKGPRFEYAQMTDGTIHVRISTFDGPGFYMRNSALQRVSADFFGYVLGAYIEHSTLGSMGDAGQPLNLDGSQVLNSYVASMNLDGYSYANGVKVERCEINAIMLDRWVPSNSSLAYNRIHALTWNRPSTTNVAELHNNNFVGTGTLLTVGADTGGSGADLNATGNYWGVAATAEMQASQQNIAAIHDFHDNTNLVIVNYSGYLTTPVVGAGPDW